MREPGWQAKQVHKRQGKHCKKLKTSMMMSRRPSQQLTNYYNNWTHLQINLIVKLRKSDSRELNNKVKKSVLQLRKKLVDRQRRKRLVDWQRKKLVDRQRKRRLVDWQRKRLVEWRKKLVDWQKKNSDAWRRRDYFRRSKQLKRLSKMLVD